MMSCQWWIALSARYNKNVNLLLHWSLSWCYKTIISSCFSCLFVEILSTWEVWRAFKRLELLAAVPWATLMPLECSPNFPLVQYIQLFRERLSEKVHTTIPTGIVGGFKCTLLQRNLKEWYGMFAMLCLRLLKESNQSRFDSYSR